MRAFLRWVVDLAGLPAACIQPVPGPECDGAATKSSPPCIGQRHERIWRMLGAAEPKPPMGEFPLTVGEVAWFLRAFGVHQMKVL